MNLPRIAVMRPGEVPTERYGQTDLQWLVSNAANGAQELTLGEATIAVGGRNPLHRHPNCEEAVYVISGEIRHVIEGTPDVRMKAGEAIFIPRNLRHQAINIGPEPARLLVTYSSPARQTVVEPAQPPTGPEKIA